MSLKLFLRKFLTHPQPKILTTIFGAVLPAIKLGQGEKVQADQGVLLIPPTKGCKQIYGRSSKALCVNFQREWNKYCLEPQQLELWQCCHLLVGIDPQDFKTGFSHFPRCKSERNVLCLQLIKEFLLIHLASLKTFPEKLLPVNTNQKWGGNLF